VKHRVAVQKNSILLGVSSGPLLLKQFSQLRDTVRALEGGTMEHRERIMLGLPLLAVTLAIGATVAIGQTDGSQQQSHNKTSPNAIHTANQDRGQQVFEQNCARCHNAPEGFSSSISGTVAMHMRVRAGLSDADYKALRRFLNP
jgi:cytochrome c5